MIAIPVGILLCIGIAVVLGLVLAKGKGLTSSSEPGGEISSAYDEKDVARLEFGKQYVYPVKDGEGKLVTTLLLEFQEPVRSNLSVIAFFSERATCRIVIKVKNLGPRKYEGGAVITLGEIEIENERGHIETARCNYSLFTVFPPRGKEDLGMELRSLGGRCIMQEQEVYEVVEILLKPGFFLPKDLTGTICGTTHGMMLSRLGRRFLLPLPTPKKEEGPPKATLCGRFRNFSDSDRRNIHNRTLSLHPDGSYKDTRQGLFNDVVTTGEWALEGRRITLSATPGGRQRPGYVVSEDMIWMQSIHSYFFRKVGSGSDTGSPAGTSP